jgi:hypothetical protein
MSKQTTRPAVADAFVEALVCDIELPDAGRLPPAVAGAAYELGEYLHKSGGWADPDRVEERLDEICYLWEAEAGAA